MNSVYRPVLSRKAKIPVYSEHIVHAGYAQRPVRGAVTIRTGLADALEHGGISCTVSNAIYVLGHEMGHVLRDTNNCTLANEYAFAHFRLLAQRLGYPKSAMPRLWKVCPYR